MVITLLLACGGSEPVEDVVAAEPAQMPVHMAASRVSLELRGQRPSPEELDAIEADPSLLDAYAEEWAESPGFAERIVSLYADVYWTRADRYIVEADGDAGFMDDGYRALFMRSVGEEPLRLLSYIADNDLPWTDIVKTDYTMANDYLLTHWPTLEAEEGEGWRVGRYIDSRPAGGVLGTNGLWWRYTSTADNLNRVRASAVGRILLCDGRYDGLVDFQSTATSESVQDRIFTDPACIGCHVSLEEIGSNFYGFWRHHPQSFTEASRYYPQREEEWQGLTGVAPGYYGEPTSSYDDLGRAIAKDPRFVNCAIEQTWGFFYGREPTLDEHDHFMEQREVFVDSDLRMRALFVSMATDPLFLSNDADWPGTVPIKRVSPDLLASEVEALTGFRWTEQAVDIMVNDDWGVRLLAGGLDGLQVTRGATDHSPASILVQERLAEMAADYAVDNELLLDSADRRLFDVVADLDVEPDEDALRVQLASLARRIWGRKLDETGEEMDEIVALWDDLLADSGDPATAWKLVLGAYLRHPDFVHY